MNLVVKQREDIRANQGHGEEVASHPGFAWDDDNFHPSRHCQLIPRYPAQSSDSGHGPQQPFAFERRGPLPGTPRVTSAAQELA